MMVDRIDDGTELFRVGDFSEREPQALYLYFLDEVFPDKERGQAFISVLKRPARYERDTVYRVTVDTIEFIIDDGRSEVHLSRILDLMSTASALELWFLVANLWLIMGNIYTNLVMVERAVECYSRVVEVEQNHQLSSMTLVAYSNLGIVYKELERHEKALDYLKKSIAELEAHPPGRQRFEGKMFQNYSLVLGLYCKLDRLEKAREIYEKMRAFDLSELGRYYSSMFYMAEYPYQFYLYSKGLCDFEACKESYLKYTSFLTEQEHFHYYIGLCSFIVLCDTYKVDLSLYESFVKEAETLYPRGHLASDVMMLQYIIKYYETKGEGENLAKLYKEFSAYSVQLIELYQESQRQSVDIVDALLINNPNKSRVGSENLELKMLYRESTEAKRELAEAYKRIELINSLGRELTSTTGLSDLIASVNEILKNHIDFDTFTLFMADEEKGVLRSLIFNYNGSLQPTLEISLDDEESLNAKCYRTRELLQVDRELEPGLKRIDIDDPVAMCSAVYLPLIVDQRVVGVYTLQHRDHDVYKHKLDFLKDLTPYMSIALNNAMKSWSLEKLSIQDGLTHISSRRFFDKKIQELLAESKEGNTTLTILMIDIDNFKNYNDTYGHLEGDQALKAVASVFRREMELVGGLSARFGGEEFVGACSHLNMEESEALGERIRKAVCELNIENKASDLGRLTVSIGLAYAKGLGLSEKSKILETADKMLYKAKSQGKNLSLLRNCLDYGC